MSQQLSTDDLLLNGFELIRVGFLQQLLQVYDVLFKDGKLGLDDFKIVSIALALRFVYL